MIHIQQKPFQLALWETEERTGEALKLDFDSWDEAHAEFQRQRQAGHYRTGILIEWHKVSGQWNLRDRFP